MTALSCKQFIEVLDDYVAGQQDPALRGAFEEHLRICRACADYVQTYRESLRLGKAAFAHPDDTVPADVPEELVRAVMSIIERRT